MCPILLKFFLHSIALISDYNQSSPHWPPWGQSKVAVVEMWPSWGGRGVKLHLFFGGVGGEHFFQCIFQRI